MSDKDLNTQIVEILGEHIDTPPTVPELADLLRLEGSARKHLERTLHQLVRDGVIVVVRAHRYALGRPADLVGGVLRVLRSGKGFVTEAATGRSVFVAAEDMSTALPGDRVLVRLHRDAEHADERGESGRIIRVLERGRLEIVGTLNTSGRFLVVVPIDSSYSKDLYVPDPAGAKEGDRVVVRFTQWDNKHVNPEGEIIEVLGPADRPDVDTLSVVRHHGLRDTFPAGVVREAETVSARVSKPGPREDLRGLYILTIDPIRARDFDDALSLQLDDQGRRVLGVHIADVSHYVTPDSALDIEARQRGNSVYLPDKVLPMLPEQLSNGACSLKPDEDRLTFSVFMTLDDDGDIVARRFCRSVIRSRLRLVYEEAMAVIEGRRLPDLGRVSGRLDPPDVTGEAGALIRDLHRLAQQLRQRRYARHALELDVPECEIVLDDEGRMIDVRANASDPSHQLVEECMVAANEAVATELANRGLPQIARLHEPPDEEKLEELSGEMQSLGYSPGNLLERRNLAAFLRSVKGDPMEYHVRVAVLRSMKRAVYSADATGHFGLAKKYYAHFTSPIRRYTDLITHRELASTLTRAKAPYRKSELQSIAFSCTQTEQTAEQAERDAVEMKKYRFLSDQIQSQSPRTYDAVVVRVVNFGLFIDVPELLVSGLVHVSALSDQFVKFNAQGQTLKAGKRTYKIGNKMKVFPVQADFASRRIDFGLA
jgi:ribonuclease R